MNGALDRLADGRPAHRSAWRRVDALFGGAVWWAASLAVVYWLVPRMCEAEITWPMHLTLALMLAACGRAWLSSVQVLRAGRAAERHRTDRGGDARPSASDADPELAPSVASDAPDAGEDDVALEDEAARRDVYLGWLGVLLSVMFAAVVVAHWIPVALLDACA